MKKQMHGFTLVELMIVVAIIAILASVALPSYQSQIRDGRRADAAAVLMQARQQMERHYSKNYTYVSPMGLPTQSPNDGGATAYYTISSGSLSDSTYTLTATPTGSQAGDRCGALTINQAGVKTSVADPVNICWR